MVKSDSFEESFENSIEKHKAFLRKRAWNEDEDNKLIQLVKQHGPYKWSFIASQMVERVGKQCRERWHNHLNPRIKKETWSENEEWNLYLAHQLIGNKWADISKTITGRTDNSIKNHWNSTMRKKMDSYRQKLLQAIHLLKTCPPKFSKKFNTGERTLIKDIVKENCLEKKQPEKKNERILLDDFAMGSNGLGPILRDFKKLTVESFQDEEFVDNLYRLTTENELTYFQMMTLHNFIEGNDEEIMAPVSNKDRFITEPPEINASPVSNAFQTPAPQELFGFHPPQVPAAFDDTNDDDGAKDKSSTSLLVPMFFINPINLNITRSLFEGPLRTPPKFESIPGQRVGPDNRYQMLSILKVMNEDNAENNSLVSSK